MEMIEERPRCCAWKLPGRPSWYASPMPVGAVQCVLSQDHHGDHRLGDDRDGDIVLTDDGPIATRDKYHRKVTGNRRQLERYANGFRVFSQVWDERPDRLKPSDPSPPNPDARSLFSELANRIDGASLEAKLGADEWRVWSKLSTMIRQVLRGPDLIEQPSLVEGQMPKHAFTRAERNSGSRWNGPPEETCWFCGTDPRNVIHEVPSIALESLYELVANAFHVHREEAKQKLLQAFYTKPGEDHESQATRDRVRDPRDDKPGNG